MKVDKQAARSFVLRIWPEPREIEGKAPVWRIRIDDVESGERAYFRTVEELGAHLKGLVPQVDEVGGVPSQ